MKIPTTAKRDADPWSAFTEFFYQPEHQIAGWYTAYYCPHSTTRNSVACDSCGGDACADCITSDRYENTVCSICSVDY